MKIASSVIDIVGHTPLVKLNRITSGLGARVVVKHEYYNPLSSVKDRVGVAMIADAERKGLIGNNTTIVEPTSGNTGIALAFVCGVRGYRLVLTMPDTMSIERRRILGALGARVVLTPGGRGMQGAIQRAEELASQLPNAFMPCQFANPANPLVHKETTAREIWEDTDGEVQVFVAGIGTGGTISGVADFLKEKKPCCHIVGVEPIKSAVLSGGKPGAHKIEGIGAGFIPPLLREDLIDEIIPIEGEVARSVARRLMVEEGIMAGLSSGAAVAVALTMAARAQWKDKLIVAIAPDTGERYLSTWLFEDQKDIDMNCTWQGM